PEVRELQAQMAMKYGIEGFSYWHYWFGNGRRILERVFDEVLKSGKPDYPFCLAWANTSWTGHWYGCGKKMLIEQKYGGIEDYSNHFYAILPAFHDKRYIRVNNHPIFLIYHPWEIPNPREFTDTWRNLAIKEGIDDIYFVGIENNNKNIESYGMQGYTWHEPNSHNQIVENYFTERLRKFKFKELPTRYSYSDFVDAVLNESLNFNQFPLVMSNWDNTPRSGRHGLVFENSTPELFRRHLRKGISLVEGRSYEERIIFLKSWNEWAEGNYVEPDQLYGSDYLKVIQGEILVER
ncbi:MAG: glycoside hydrolase family 99-like domain-containing protein, partial [Bacteroidota bacterium]